jgi:immune inhibitor A
MKNKFFGLALAAILTITLMGSFPVAQTSSTIDIVKSVQSLGMFQTTKFSAHYRAPNTDQIEIFLEEHGIPLGSPEAIAQAVKTFQTEWAKRNPTTPNPEKFAALLARERLLQANPAAGKTASADETPQIMSLAVPVEFPNSDTFDWCGAPVTTVGPLHNQIPAPGPKDNNTLWYDNATPALYNELYFGVGPKAGVIVNHPNLGKIDFRGSTMANYYIEQSGGLFVPEGEVYPKWLQASHSEGWYGADSESWDAGHTTCVAGGNHNVRAGDLVMEVVDAINVDNPSFAWQTYDGNGDGIVDNFTVIHAGMGQEGGGGLQGDFSIWSHASAINYPTGKLACTMGSTGCPDRNIYVREYSMDPENIDVGVISEEFGHAAFGLPDIYTTDAQASPSNWVIMEAGSWNGKLGGMQPAPFPLFFRYLVGWADPVVLDYTTDAETIKVGQLSQTPKNTEPGIKINLPDSVVNIPNPLGTGKAWWSGKGDLSDFYLTHDFDLTTATAPIFSFASAWSIEQDWDYGYVEVSDDAGATWTILPDMDGKMVNTNPNGNNKGWGLTGEGTGTVRFDLASYAGKQVKIRLHYSTDMATQWNGWWADDLKLVDGAITLFTDDVETPPNGWTTNHFVIVPFSQTFPRYYLAEWRNNSGFDKGLVYPYTTIYDNPATTEWQVDRCPYTVPGMLLWLRNAAYDFDYTLTDSIQDPPSWGTKHALLVVDSHYWPLEWNSINPVSEANRRLNSRCQPGNATFTVPNQKTTPFTVRRSNAAGDILETKTFTPLPAVSQFHDSLGYYPGLWYNTNPDPNFGGLWWWDIQASLVVPAKDDYTTRITWLDKTPATDLYGASVGNTTLGSGDPRDNGVQFGLNIAVLNKAKNGSWGNIAVWNATTLVDLSMKVDLAKAYPGQVLKYQLKVKNTSPAPQTFKVSDPIPANTTYFKGQKGFSYNAISNTIEWTGTVYPNQTKVIQVWVKVNKDTPTATEIKNVATLSDDALGDSASVITMIRRH